MISLTFANVIRENHEETIQCWLKSIQGRVAEDYQQVLQTPMGRAVATTLLGLAMELLSAEEYQRAEILHRVRDAANDDAFRRTAVGFCLPDLITDATLFRQALEETLFNHVNPASGEEFAGFRAAFTALNKLGDALISGKVSGYFTYRDFRDKKAEDGRPV
ncbi:MAG: hypothetical protein M1309_04820 [Actinobacteria bacterium]|nr:hypothetical protein [Actinomycetota bacterium]